MWASTRRGLLNCNAHSQNEIRFFPVKIKSTEFCWICFEMLPPLTLRHFLIFVISFFYVLLSQLFNFSLLISPFNILFCQWWTSFLTAEVILATHSFKYSFRVIAAAIIRETVNFFLLSGCVKNLNFEFWSQFVIEGQNHVLKISCYVFHSFKPTTFRGILPSCVKSGRHLLTHWECIKLARVNSNDSLANIRRVTNVCFIDNSFSKRSNFQNRLLELNEIVIFSAHFVDQFFQ